MGRSIAIKRWGREDVKHQLQALGFRGTDEEIDAVCCSQIIKRLGEKTFEDWEIITDAIYEKECSGNISKINDGLAGLRSVGLRFAQCRDCNYCNDDTSYCSYWCEQTHKYDLFEDCGHGECFSDCYVLTYDERGEYEFDIDIWLTPDGSDRFGKASVLDLVNAIKTIQIGADMLKELHDYIEDNGGVYDEGLWSVDLR